VSRPRGASSVSHFLFADDSLILMKMDAPNVTTVRKVLDMYCASSGQLVSDPKSLFSLALTQEWGIERLCVGLSI
jgi:hypothetical protein